MFKILLALLLMTSSAWATQWRSGSGENTLLGTSNAADIDYNSFNSIVKPLDSLLATYCNQFLIYNSSSTITVSAGSVMVSNSGGTIRLMLQNTGTTNITSANLDTGSLMASTTYYVYAAAITNGDTAATYYISASNTAPSGVTYYFQIGSFITDSNTNITSIHNNYGSQGFGASSSKTSGVVYQATTNGIVTAYMSSSPSNTYYVNLIGYSDSSSSPSTVVAKSTTYNDEHGATSTPYFASITFPVKSGDYYEVTSAVSDGSGSNSVTVNFIPLS